jgi:hypothetical protein
MSYRLHSRLSCLEAHLAQVRPYPALVVAPVGTVVDAPAYGLVVVVHVHGCDDPYHEGTCAPHPSGGDPYATP